MVVILVKERIAEADQMTVVTAIGRRNTTEEETVRMTTVVVVEAQEGITEVATKAREVEENPTDKEAAVSPVSTETTGLQKGQVEAVDAVATISANRVTIILADRIH